MSDLKKTIFGLKVQFDNLFLLTRKLSLFILVMIINALVFFSLSYFVLLMYLTFSILLFIFFPDVVFYVLNLLVCLLFSFVLQMCNFWFRSYTFIAIQLVFTLEILMYIFNTANYESTLANYSHRQIP